MSEIVIEYRWKNSTLEIISPKTGIRVDIVGEASKARAAAFLSLSDVSAKPQTTTVSERVWDNFLKRAY